MPLASWICATKSNAPPDRSFPTAEKSMRAAGSCRPLAILSVIAFLEQSFLSSAARSRLSYHSPCNQQKYLQSDSHWQPGTWL